MDRFIKLFHNIPTVFFIALILYFGQVVFVPLFFGLFIAMVLYPVCKYLEHKHWPRSVAIAASLFIVFVVFSFLVWLLVLQVQAFLKDLPTLKAKMSPSVIQLQQWIENNFNIPADQQTQV